MQRHGRFCEFPFLAEFHRHRRTAAKVQSGKSDLAQPGLGPLLISQDEEQCTRQAMCSEMFITLRLFQFDRAPSTKDLTGTGWGLPMVSRERPGTE